jgi:SAM-dependent methyltransferase
MHHTALVNGKQFHDVYVRDMPGDRLRVLEIGSQDVNGSLRQFYGPRFEYVGVDFAAAKGVDVVLSDPYTLPFDDASADVVLSNSCLEHSEMFWLVVLEALRVLRPHGLLYLNVPSNGEFHRYPVDCWRFYPDSGQAMVNWARRNGMRPRLLESFTGEQVRDVWNDMIIVVVKDEAHAAFYPQRMHAARPDASNVRVMGSPDVRRLQPAPEDKRRLYAIRRVLTDAVSPQRTDAEKLALIGRIATGAVKVR